MNFAVVEKAFHILDETARIIEAECDCTYIEALAETAENMFHDDVLQDELSETTRKRLIKQYASLSFMELDAVAKRKAFQLAILKGMKANVQPNHQMTPDSIGLFMGYLVGKLSLSLIHI